ncbi:MAG: Gfo/Idh/MocA family protein [Ancrocorticia sp.]|uniref:Gfo/Idh/MocA family protein n=1 Tax=Ancrocorticia sp. TaxID=2593684 RepID=UPI003F93A645
MRDARWPRGPRERRLHMVTIGLLGLGRIGAMHAKILAPLADRLVVADTRPQLTADFAAEVPGVEVRTPDQLLASSDLDGLVITTPTDTHAATIDRAAGLGIPIFCEKPVSTDLATTLEVARIVREKGVRLQMGFQRHFDAGYTTARNNLRAGKIGDLRRVHMGTLDQAPAPREFLAASGGIYTDCLIHDFDALRWVSGQEVSEAYAIGTDLGMPDFADFGDVAETVVLLTLTNGALVTAHSSRFNGAGYDVRMELHGTLGTDTVGLDEHLPMTSTEPAATYPAGDPWVDFILRFKPAYEAEMRAFMEVAAGTGNITAGIEDAVAALRISEACSISRREHRPVRLEEIAAEPPSSSQKTGNEA